MNTAETPVTLGDDLLALQDANHADPDLVEMLGKMPHAWLVLHQTELREDPTTGFRVAAFVCPTLAHLAECDPLHAPAVYTLAECAGHLVERGMGALLLPPTNGDAEGFPLSCGDLVQLLLEGTLKSSTRAHEWAPPQAFTDAPDRTLSTFLQDPANPDVVAKLETARPPPQVVPPQLEVALKKYMADNLPHVSQPVLARNPAGLLALVFVANAAADIQENRDALAKLSWFFPRHYHLLCVPRSQV